MSSSSRNLFKLASFLIAAANPPGVLSFNSFSCLSVSYIYPLIFIYSGFFILSFIASSVCLSIVIPSATFNGLSIYVFDGTLSAFGSISLLNLLIASPILDSYPLAGSISDVSFNLTPLSLTNTTLSPVSLSLPSVIPTPLVVVLNGLPLASTMSPALDHISSCVDSTNSASSSIFNPNLPRFLCILANSIASPVSFSPYDVK